jgi:hypothetical protein
MTKGRGKAVLPLGIIALIPGGSLVTLGEEDTVFRIETPSRTYELRAASAEMRQQWVKAVRKVIGKTRGDMTPKAVRMLLGDADTAALDHMLSCGDLLTQHSRCVSRKSLKKRSVFGGGGLGRAVGAQTVPSPSNVVKEVC